MSVIDVWKNSFRVNADGAGTQLQSDIVGLSNGNVLVVWVDNNDTTANGFGYDVLGQLYDPFGKKIGGPLFLNQNFFNDRNEALPAVDATDDGGFILTYQAPLSNDHDQLFMRFDADGASTGINELVISDVNDSDRFNDHEIIYRPDGSSVLVFRRSNTPSDNHLVFKVISADGTEGSETLIRNDSFGAPIEPTLTMLPDGTIVVGFLDPDTNGYGPEYALIFPDNSTNAPEGTVNAGVNVVINPIGLEDVDVAALSGGDFVITWRDGNTIYGRTYDRDSNALTGALVLAGDTDVKQDPQVIGLKEDDRYAVIWLDKTDNEISMRVFNADGTVVSSKRDLPFPGDDALELAVSLTADGRILISWSDKDSDGDYDIYSAILDPRDGRFTAAEDGAVTVARDAGGQIDGTDGADTIYGQDGEDHIRGLKANDLLRGGDNRDLLEGGKGNDEQYGENGADTVSGDKGNDTLFGGSGNDKIFGGDGKDGLIGNQGRDVLNGGKGNDRLFGGDGKDKLSGGGGKDFLGGGKGADVLKAGGGDDKLNGEAGADKITGGGGQDLIIGGGGPDTFIYTKAGDSKAGANNRDTIFFFDHKADTINLRAIDADTTRGGNQAFDFIRTDKFSDAGDLRIKKAGGDLIVQADRNGDGKADFEIYLESPDQISAGDFIL